MGAKGGTPLPHLSWGERPLITLGGHPTFRDALTQTLSRADPPMPDSPSPGLSPPPTTQAEARSWAMGIYSFTAALRSFSYSHTHLLSTNSPGRVTGKT